MSNSVFQTRDQKFASVIYQQIQEIKQQPVANQKRYGVIAHQLPILIRTAGLAQTLVFISSRSKKKETGKEDEFSLFLSHLTKTINLDTPDIVQYTIQVDLSSYMYITQQLLDALLWYKRFAQSILGVDPTDQLDEKQGDEE
ncbi:type III-B CRISPR module-associated protein Cmr5 [Herpetosiphon llansteffanensis]|uniref:type III-B CRISPR module-associated protein Cmr5 n=1 Tax=Herpetosiphon llansteffanensis TaxID=2094568 RepID=UPI000D7BE548|nr:type III-B CRISPR module-associated protein Cmr5 [Herpetosiphon llansteffanensis]